MILFTYEGNECRVSKAISSVYPTVSYSALNKALRRKDILVNGARIKEDIRVKSGDVIQAYIVVPKIEYDILYEDEHIAVVYKPKGISVTGAQSLTECLGELTDTYIPCHRLDTNTDGLVMYAKSDEYFHHVKDAMHDEQIFKLYLARVWGVPSESSSDMRAYLIKNSRQSTVSISDTYVDDSIPIRTIYNTVEVLDDGTSILEVRLIAGKTHQIRAHLAHIGYPIIGDSKYCPRHVREKFGYAKQLLTAYKLVFDTRGALSYLKGKVIQISPKLYK